MPRSVVPALCRLQLHGLPASFDADGRARPLERKHAALLAYLWREGPTPRARLAGLLWPAAGEARARANLRQRLLRLRQDHGPLVHDDGPLLALSDTVSVLAADPAQGGLLGDLAFDDCDDLGRWLDACREADLGRHKREHLTRVREAAQTGRLDEALAVADDLLQIDRESEEAYRALMEVYYLRGDHAAALAAWDRCREMLRTLYGVRPSAATEQLGHSLLVAASALPSFDAVPATPRTVLPATVLRPPRLVGRAAALQQLAAAWQARQVACVCAAAGLGKSRLLADLLAALPATAETTAGTAGSIRVAARPGDELLPYASLSRLLLALQARWPAAFDPVSARRAAGLLPQLAAALPADGEPPAPVRTDYERTQALLALAQVLGRTCGQGLHTLALDDLQYADAASLAALRVLARAEDDTGPQPRWLLACRPDEGGEDLAATLRDLAAPPRGRRVDLAPLAADETAELLDSLNPGGHPALAALQARAEALWQHAGGNPAFLLETVKLLLTEHADADLAAGAPLPLPEGQRAVIERRLALLSPQARHLVQLAAVAGRDYSVELAAEALACAPLLLTEPLRELELRQVFYGRHFVHDVVGTVVRDAVPAAMAEFMHRFVAGHLLRRYGDDPARAATLATHWAAAGEPLRAATAYARAADAARDAALPAQQAALLDHAIGVLEPVAGAPDAPEARALLFDLLARRATVYELAGFAAQRLAVVARLEQMAASEPQRLQALNLRSGAQVDVAQAPDEAALQAAVSRARALGDEALAWQLTRTLAWHWAMNDRSADAMALLDNCLPWMTGTAPAADRVSFRLARSSVHAFGDVLDAAIGEGNLAIEAALAANDLVNALPALSNVGLFHYWRGEYPQARERLTLGRTLRDSHVGRDGAGIKLDLHLGAVLAESGDSAAAEAMLKEAQAAIHTWPDGEQRRTEALLVDNHLAQMYLVEGRWAEAQRLLAREDGGVADRFRGRRLALRLRWHRLQGQTAPALVAELQALTARLASPFNRLLMQLELLRQPVEAAGAAGALQALQALADQPAARQRPGLRLHALAVAASRARDAAQPDRALGLVAQVRDLAGRCAPFDLGRDEFERLLAHAERADDGSGQAPP